MHLFDAHTHLQNYPAAHLAGALAAAAAAGVKGMLCCATRPADWQRVLAISAGNASIVPCLGIHPWFAAEAGPGWLDKLEGLLLSGAACVGEIGLDGARPAAGQEKVFAAQLQLANRLNRPAVIHCVRAWGRVLAILRSNPALPVMLHAYGGAPELVKDFSALGCYFSFGAGLAGAARAKQSAALKAVPRGRLLFETDAPASDGSGCGPADIAGVIISAAEILGAPVEELAELSYNNGREFVKLTGCGL